MHTAKYSASYGSLGETVQIMNCRAMQKKLSDTGNYSFTFHFAFQLSVELQMAQLQRHDNNNGKVGTFDTSTEEENYVHVAEKVT